MTTHHHTWCIRQSRVLSALHYVPKLSWFWICDSPFYRFSYCSLAIILPATPCCSKCLPGFNSSPCLLMFCSRSSSISPGLMQGLLKGTCSSASHLIPNQPTHYGQDKLASVKLHSHQCLARKTAGDSPPPACWIGVWFSTQIALLYVICLFNFRVTRNHNTLWVNHFFYSNFNSVH